MQWYIDEGAAYCSAYMYEDFTSINKSGTVGAADWCIDETDATADATLTAVADVGHVLRLEVDTTDDIEIWAIHGGSQGGAFNIDTNNGELWWECRYRQSSIADDTSIMLGIGGIAAAGDDKLQTDDTGAPVLSFLGFNTLTADGDALLFTHGTTGTNVALISPAQVPVASTFYKVGIHFDGKTTVTAYVDNVPNATTVEVSATSFPNGLALAPTFASRLGDALTQTLDIDWVKCAQLRP